MKKLLGAAAVVALVLIAPALARGRGAVTAKTVSSSRLIHGGRVRCTATFTTPVAAGQRVANTFSLRNVSSHPVAVAYRGGSFVLRSTDGTKYDTNLPLQIGKPPPSAITIRPGATRTEDVFAPRIRWSGPLRITPMCDGKRLPVVRVPVTAPGPVPSGSAAVAAVVKASGFLLRHCRPTAPGIAVQGEIVAPDGSAPAMRARCVVSTRLEDGFVQAQLVVVAPPHRLVRLKLPYEQLWLPRRTPPVEAIAWEFVVTGRGATPVAAETAFADHSAAGRFAPGWTWTRSGWKSASPDPCSGGEGSFGGKASPTVYFISACPS